MMNSKSTIILFTSLMLILFSTACNKDKDDDMDMDMDPDPVELTLETPCKYDIILGSESFSEDATDGDPSCNVTSGASGTPDYKYELTPGSTLADFDTGEGLSVDKSFFLVDNFGNTPTDAEFEAFFAVGNYNYSPDSEQGIQITYKDSDGVRWSSSHDSADQSGSTFEITEMVSGTFQNAFYVSLRATFKCNLYNDAGELKASSGSFTLQFKNFFI